MSPIDSPLLAVPDSTVLLLGWVSYLVLLSVQRRYLGPLSQTYTKLPAVLKYDWDQRVVNLVFNLVQAPFNLYLLLGCPETVASPLYGYPPVAHAGFLLVAAFYMFDAVLFVAHPAPGVEHVRGWVAHHLFAAGMLGWLTAFQRTSALPAAVFLVSAAGHVLNEVRWFLRTTGTRSWRRLYNAVGVGCNVVIFVTCIVPPPYLVWVAARLRGVGWWHMFARQMRWACVACFLTVWVPHCALFIVQVRRTVRNWGGVWDDKASDDAKQM